MRNDKMRKVMDYHDMPEYVEYNYNCCNTGQIPVDQEMEEEHPSASGVVKCG